ncbi:MAG: DUF1501 domain-containing protein, partial [Lentisphaeraceae bacterium]|nr:DUF1501 domain-containing protein [Lentisphaeraceae bacterium]
MSYFSTNMNRRNFLQGAAGTLLGSTFAANSLEAARLPRKGQAQSVIYVYLNGGLSQLDSFDIKPENKEVSGLAGALKTSADGVRVSKFFPKLARQMHNVAVINSLSTTQGAHPEGNYFMRTSYTSRSSVVHPELGAWCSKYLPKINPTLPSFVKIGGSATSGAGYFDGKYGALPIGDPKSGLQNGSRHRWVKEEQFDRRIDMLDEFNQGFNQKYNQKLVHTYSDIYKEALNLMDSQDLATFDIRQEKEKVLDSYGHNTFGRGCLMARRLAEKGVRFIEVNSHGWDHHSDIYKGFGAQAAEVDQGLATL